jgi:glutamine synthetase type III
VKHFNLHGNSSKNRYGPDDSIIGCAAGWQEERLFGFGRIGFGILPDSPDEIDHLYYDEIQALLRVPSFARSEKRKNEYSLKKSAKTNQNEYRPFCPARETWPAFSNRFAWRNRP